MRLAARAATLTPAFEKSLAVINLPMSGRSYIFQVDGIILMDHLLSEIPYAFARLPPDVWGLPRQEPSLQRNLLPRRQDFSLQFLNLRARRISLCWANCSYRMTT